MVGAFDMAMHGLGLLADTMVQPVRKGCEGAMAKVFRVLDCS